MSARADRQVRALCLARDCCELGARARTIHYLTGLAPREVQRLFFAGDRPAPRGRAPDSPEWYHSANLLARAEASIFVSAYRRLRKGGFAASETLIAAYRHYRSVCQPMTRVSFDRAFDLGSHADGIWVASKVSLSLAPCLNCRSEFLVSAGEAPSALEHCPFCKLLQRYELDQRVQTSFPWKLAPQVDGVKHAVATMVQRHSSFGSGNSSESPIFPAKEPLCSCSESHAY